MEKIGPCKKCDEKHNIVAKNTRDDRFRILCRTCGHVIISETSPEEAINEWNTWSDGPQIPADPNIPISPDGSFQIYQLLMKKDGVHRIVYAVPRSLFPSSNNLNNCNDLICESLEEAVKYAEINRREFEEKVKQAEEEQRLRDEWIAEQKKREYMYGFEDSKSPMHRRRIIQHMQKIWNFQPIAEVMTMRDFIHHAYLQGNPEMKIYEDKYDSRGHLRETPKRSYFINHADVGKTAYDYMEYLIKNKIKVEAKS